MKTWSTTSNRHRLDGEEMRDNGVVKFEGVPASTASASSTNANRHKKKKNAAATAIEQDVFVKIKLPFLIDSKNLKRLRKNVPGDEVWCTDRPRAIEGFEQLEK